jgi:hypothetical protein
LIEIKKALFFDQVYANSIKSVAKTTNTNIRFITNSGEVVDHQVPPLSRYLHNSIYNITNYVGHEPYEVFFNSGLFGKTFLISDEINHEFFSTVIPSYPGDQLVAYRHSSTYMYSPDQSLNSLIEESIYLSNPSYRLPLDAYNVYDIRAVFSKGVLNYIVRKNP